MAVYPYNPAQLSLWFVAAVQATTSARSFAGQQ